MSVRVRENLCRVSVRVCDRVCSHGVCTGVWLCVRVSISACAEVVRCVKGDELDYVLF